VKVVLLDRDGVINQDRDDYVKSPEEWQPIPGSLEAIARLGDAGFRVVVLSNQSGLARGLFDAATLDAIHAKMQRAVEEAGGRLEAVFFCPHAPDAGCDCRKPKVGLIRQAEEALGKSLVGAPLVGDKPSDLALARNAGCRPVLVRTGKGGSTERTEELEDVAVFDDLASFVAETLSD
jgi:D-glycero-D-manno-heptose 1,7-bisphosphate phosphatase